MIEPEEKKKKTILEELDEEFESLMDSLNEGFEW